MYLRGEIHTALHMCLEKKDQIVHHRFSFGTQTKSPERKRLEGKNVLRKNIRGYNARKQKVCGTKRSEGQNTRRDKISEGTKIRRHPTFTGQHIQRDKKSGGIIRPETKTSFCDILVCHLTAALWPSMLQ
jgi:hypothetical protein